MRNNETNAKNAKSRTVKVRFAPSPTGLLHVGGLRTALFNFLFARKLSGVFALRIEDTDKNREVQGAADEIIKTLKDFDLNFDEGPVFQSKRLEIYKKHAEELVERGTAYRDGQAIRQKINREGKTVFEDAVYGKITVENAELDEGVLLKSDGYPVYNLANVVDDHLTGITHVLRGEEFIPSTPKHILLYQAFGWQPPVFVHLPLILDKQKKKLSKRTGDVAVSEYLRSGYLKETLLNFVALLGWNPKTEQEIFSLDELISEFDIAKINKAGAVFDISKLDFINRQWQKRLNLETHEPMHRRTKKLLEEKFGKIDEKFFAAVWPLVLERVKGPSELEERLPEFYFFFEDPKYEADLLIWKTTPRQTIKQNLNEVYKIIEKSEITNLKSEITNLTSKQGTGETLWPLRVALTGVAASPGPLEVIEAFLAHQRGKSIILSRIKRAIEKL